MNALDILDHARDTLTVRRVFGEPIERDGLLVVPVAAVAGGAGAGSGEEGGPAESPAAAHGGIGGGWGGSTRGIGVFVIGDGQVRWEPAVDVTRLIVGSQVALIVGLLVLRSIVRARRRRT
jgi:uncharacterized spore protein YtfJ